MDILNILSLKSNRQIKINADKDYCKGSPFSKIYHIQTVQQLAI